MPCCCTSIRIECQCPVTEVKSSPQVVQIGADAVAAEREAQRSAEERHLPYISPYSDLQVRVAMARAQPDARRHLLASQSLGHSTTVSSLSRARAPGHGYPVPASSGSGPKPSSVPMTPYARALRTRSLSCWDPTRRAAISFRQRTQGCPRDIQSRLCNLRC